MIRARAAGLMFLGLALTGCSEDEIPPPMVEVFWGELAVVRISESDNWTYLDTDMVIFTVEGNTYSLDHFSNQSGLCNSQGRVMGFGTNMLTLIPTKIDYANCDTLRIPQGEFKSVYDGDKLYLGPDTQVFRARFIDTMVYHFKLTK